ncbi:hypothetical protein B296_00013434 [Ensete ventricosum]|uniref:Uncharacterized protein n=1 Tax=Ensete ventricosum TaxID=4639 RepID=A0A426ZGT1_ENSVE|nr:hypothetical protein B296_00013434 [Ensete ventricosum]
MTSGPAEEAPQGLDTRERDPASTMGEEAPPGWERRGRDLTNDPDEEVPPAWEPSVPPQSQAPALLSLAQTTG